MKKPASGAGMGGTSDFPEGGASVPERLQGRRFGLFQRSAVFLFFLPCVTAISHFFGIHWGFSPFSGGKAGKNTEDLCSLRSGLQPGRTALCFLTGCRLCAYGNPAGSFGWTCR